MAALRFAGIGASESAGRSQSCFASRGPLREIGHARRPVEVDATQGVAELTGSLLSTCIFCPVVLASQDVRSRWRRPFLLIRSAAAAREPPRRAYAPTDVGATDHDDAAVAG
jgi:hypothetical protein